MANLSKAFMRAIGNEIIPAGESALANSATSAVMNTIPKALSNAGSNALKNIFVKKAPSVAENIPVALGDASKINLYRGIRAETPELLDKYIGDMMNPSIKPRTYEGAAYGEGYYFTPFRDSAESYASNDPSKPYQAVLQISPTKNRFLGINKANKNRPVDFTIRAEERGVPGGMSLSVGERDYENYLRRNGILGNRVKSGLDDSVYVVTDNDALKGMQVIGNKTPGKEWEYNSKLSNIFPSGTKVSFDKDLNISSVKRPANGRGWFASNENNPHVSKAIQEAKPYLPEPKYNLNENGTGTVDLSYLNTPKPMLEMAEPEISPEVQSMVGEYLGEPKRIEPKRITAYHGSPTTGIENFDLDMAGKNTLSGEKAIYFTDSPEVAEDFSYSREPTNSMFFDKKGDKGEVYERTLNLKNPLDLGNLTDEQIEYLWDYADPRTASLMDKEKFIQVMNEAKKAGNDQMIKAQLDLEKLANSDYDSFIAKMYPGENDVREYGVFNPDVIEKPTSSSKLGNLLPEDYKPMLEKTEVDANLSPEQREFFKDSVVRDDEGNLMPMYHGSSSEFSVFDINKSGKSNTIASVGFWFSPDKKGAKEFAENVFYGDNKPKTYEVYLNMKNPKVYTSEGVREANKAKILALEDENDALKPKIDELAEEWMWGDQDGTRTREEADALKKELDKMREIYRNNENQIEDLRYDDAYEMFRSDVYAVEGKRPYDANVGGLGSGLENSLETVPKYVEELKKQGYDGIIIKGTQYDSGTLGSQNKFGENDQYVVFDPEQIKNVNNLNPTSNPDIRLSKGSESLTDIGNRLKAMNKSREMSSDIRTIGSKEVAKIDENTLPKGYKDMVEYINEDPTSLYQKIVGVDPEDATFPEKIAKWLEDEGYDVSKNVVDNMRMVRRAYAEQLVEKINLDGGYSPRTFLETRSMLEKDNPGKGLGPRTYTISAEDGQIYQTNAAKMDREYSNRLGIGRSHTPMNDNSMAGDAQGAYFAGGIGLDEHYATGESGVSTVAHERMHAWQDAREGDWDARFIKARDELRNELADHYHSRDQIKKDHPRGDVGYYARDIEQEARMLQSYLDNEGFTNTWKKQTGKVEWGDEIKPAFDKFYKKLRSLSKAGVSLPAIALLFGLNTNGGEKDSKKA